MEEEFTDFDFTEMGESADPAIYFFKKIAIMALKNLADNEDAQEYIRLGTQSIDDFIQEKIGKVSKRSPEDAIQLAINTSRERDDRTIQRIISVITVLYATHEVSRGAIVGGTLLKEFGENVYPHINKKELRFAVPINQKLLQYVSNDVEKIYKQLKSKYNINEYADYTDVQKNYNSSINYLGGPVDTILNLINKIFK